MLWILWVLLGILLLLITIVLLRTLFFKPRKEEPLTKEEISFDKEGAVASLRTLLGFRTISRYTQEEEDEAEFTGLVAALDTLYPAMSATCTKKTFEGRGLLYRWAGKAATGATVLMAHYDVVPAEGNAWRHPPFDAVLDGGVLYGRGALDTKVTVNAILYAADTLIREGFVPEEDIYFAFSGSEEVGGAGAANIVAHFAAEGIPISLVLDEGGAVVTGAFPGVKAPTAMVGIAEKGMIDLAYRVRTAGGHASAPKPTTAIGTLARAVTELEAHPPRMRLCRPVRMMFDTLGRHASFFYRMLFANLWLFSGLLGRVAKRRGGELNALLRTTVAFTRMKGSDANNVLPSEASLVSNIRLNPADTVDSTMAYLRRTIDDPTVQLHPLKSTNPSRISLASKDGWEKVKAAVRRTFDEPIVTPYLMIQCSDSRHWGELSDRVYRFSPLVLSAEERRSIHGQNERIRIEQIEKSVEFYLHLMRSC